MSTFSLVWNYLKAKPLNTALNIVLLSLGIAVVTILLLFSTPIEEKIYKNTKGIDLVVGAKGSPLQIILCNIFHIDFPTGNINLVEAEKIAHNRLVKKAIPMALGDSYHNYRIVGTTTDYATLYHAELKQGNWWMKNEEVVIGATVASVVHMNVDDTFASTHGLSAGGGDHDEHKFTVVGILKPSNTVLDNLILTSVQSIWLMHEHDIEGISEHEAVINPSILIPTIEAGDSTKEITSMLIQYRSPMGAIQLPRLVNANSNMQAASPAFETARLFTILGVGFEIVTGFAFILIFISALSIFIALYNSLKERKYDLAIMRSMGATRSMLVVTVLLEGMLLTATGSILGLLTGHGTLFVLSATVEEIHKAGLSGVTFYIQEWIIFFGSIALGLLCSLLPAWQAYRTDISKVLAGN